MSSGYCRFISAVMKFAYSSMKRSCWQIHPISTYTGLNADFSVSSPFQSAQIRRSIFCVLIWLIEIYYYYRLQEHELNSKQLAVVAVRTKNILYTSSHDYSASSKPSMQHGISPEMDFWLLDSNFYYGLLIILFRNFLC